MTAGLIDPLREIALSDPERRALLAGGRPVATFAHLVRQLDAAHGALGAAGVVEGSRVATVLPDSPETAVAILAIASLATCIPLNPAYPQAEIERLVGEAAATHLVTASSAAGFTGPVHITLHRRIDEPPGSFDLKTSHVPPPAPAPLRPDQRVALVLHTSGSTGTPKRVPLTVDNLSHSARNLAASLSLGADDVCLNMMPMFHIGALVDLMLGPLGAGGAVAFADTISASAMFRALGQFQPTWFQAVPTVLRDVLSHAATPEDSAALSRLRLVRAVSQPLPVALQDAFEQRFGVPLVPIFGMTETAGLIASMPLGQRVPGSVGRPSGPEVRVVDAFGNAQPSGRRGEVVISGNTVMAGYEGAAGELRDAFFGRWLRSGDEGYFDEAGFLFLTGRLKDIINRGGEKISPLEIDLLLADHKLVVEAAAFPVPHPTLGEDVAVAVVRRGELTSRDVVDFLRPRLAEFKVPRQVVFLEKLPRLPSGKLDRLALPNLAGSAEGKARTAPQEEIALVLAALWRETLDIDDVALEDDFFDLGGDSLRATRLALRLEERFGRDIPVAELFDVPTLEAMARMLAEAARRQSSEDALDPAIHSSMTRVLAGWQGTRLPGSLITGRNTLGSRTPFFWIPQSLHGFEAVASVLHPDRPIYGMTSLSQTGLKTDANTLALARYYAREMQRIRPEGDFLIGGFCQGGVVAFHVATALRSAGRNVALLALQDRFVPEPYDGALALFWGKRDAMFELNQRPERSWAKYYSGPVAVHFADADHDHLHNAPHVQLFGEQLEAELTRAERCEPPAAPLAPVSMLPGPLQFRIDVRVPRLLRQGSERRVRVTVSNWNDFAWPPTSQSGVVVVARWRVDDQEFPFFGPAPVYLGDAQADLVDALAPGASTSVDMTVRVPMWGLPMSLEFDVVEDGMYFDDRVRPTRFRKLIWPLRPRPSDEA